MNGIEKITGQIEADVQREIDDLTAQAQAQAAEILADYEARARAEAEATLKRGALAAAQREERLGDMARLEARKLTLGTKQEMVERAFQRALEKLTSLPDAEYVSLLANLAAAGSRSGHRGCHLLTEGLGPLRQAGRHPGQRHPGPEGGPKLPEELTGSKAGAILDKVVAGASAVLAGTGMLTLAEESRPMAGGLILRDNNVETNCSFEVLIHLQRDALAAEVAKTLFD
ncbi:MAG: V-type ATP synthase subunit E [Intestinimonas sp.]